jgi:hypothetical protein
MLCGASAAARRRAARCSNPHTAQQHKGLTLARRDGIGQQVAEPHRIAAHQLEPAAPPQQRHALPQHQLPGVHVALAAGQPQALQSQLLRKQRLQVLWPPELISLLGVWVAAPGGGGRVSAHCKRDQTGPTPRAAHQAVRVVNATTQAQLSPPHTCRHRMSGA